MRIHASGVLAASVLIAMSGCAKKPADAGATPAPVAEPAAAAMAAPAATASLDGTAWVLASLGSGAPVTDPAPTARFDGGTMSGSDGCNRYILPVTFTDTSFEAGMRGPSTMMACPPDRTALAAAYMEALTGARGHRLSGANLELLDADGVVVATFAPQATGLAGTTWKATGINNGREALVSVVTGSEVTITFEEGGQANGSSGCNRFMTSWEADGNNVKIGPAAGTRMMCEDPKVMEQEAAFLKALETVATKDMEGDRLTLRDANGAMAATFTKAN